MKLVNARWMFELEMSEDFPTVLVLENSDAMSEIVEDLYNLCSGEDGESILSEKSKELSVEKTAEIIINPFSIDFNSKKIQNKLYGELLSVCDDYIEEKAKLQTMAIKYLDRIIQDVPYEMITSDIDMDLIRLFKMFEVRLEPQCNSILERVIEYIKVMSRLMKKTLLILVNVCSYLNDVEIHQLVEICIYHKMNLLFIESLERPFLIPTKKYIIDKDKCVIIK